jgi:Leucine-rich repeat (LRR) protein
LFGIANPIGQIKNLENLYCRNNGIKSLYNLNLPNLKVLDIRDNNISESDTNEFKSKHPQCRIYCTIDKVEKVFQ